jgi:hypothetical protein
VDINAATAVIRRVPIVSIRESSNVKIVIRRKRKCVMTNAKVGNINHCFRFWPRLLLVSHLKLCLTSHFDHKYPWKRQVDRIAAYAMNGRLPIVSIRDISSAKIVIRRNNWSLRLRTKRHAKDK